MSSHQNWIRYVRSGLFTLLLSGAAGAQQHDGKAAALGSAPPPSDVPRVEFAFEFRVTLAPAVVVGETAWGQRQYIPITGGQIAGPKFTGEILPGGWDYQLGLSNGCKQLSADYFIQAKDGTRIHVVDVGQVCSSGGRSIYQPRFEAPKGPYEWMSNATFVVTVDAEKPAPGATGVPGAIGALHLRFYQVE